MERVGGFAQWCLRNAENPYVKRYVPWVGKELRYQLLVLREQVSRQKRLRAKLRKPRMPKSGENVATKEKKPWDVLTEPVTKMRRRPKRRKESKPKRKLRPKKPLPAAT
eukprot:scaffold535_cov260-Pinguiococcus_pyrenoidosus.AAC.1